MPVLDLAASDVLPSDWVEAAATCDALADADDARRGGGPLGAALRVDLLRRSTAPFYLLARLAHAAAHAEQPTAARLAELDAWDDALVRTYHGEPDGPLLVALAEAARRHRVPLRPLQDLLHALRIEAIGGEFGTLPQLEEHARRSAGACGCVLMYLADAATPDRLARAEDLGVALRLLDVIVDLRVDARAGRVLVPRAELEAFGVTREDLADPDPSPPLRELIAFLGQRTRTWLARAAPLLRVCVPPIRELVDTALRGSHAVLRTIAPPPHDVSPVSSRANDPNSDTMAPSA